MLIVMVLVDDQGHDLDDDDDKDDKDDKGDDANNEFPESEPLPSKL